MPKVKGYTSYHGRGPLWKLAVTVLLLAVILASFGVLFLKRSMVVNSDGVPQVQLPWMNVTETPSGEEEASGTKAAPDETPAAPDGESGEQTPPETEPEPEPEPAPPAVEPFHVYPVQAAPLSLATYDEISYILKRNNSYNAVSVRLKDAEGWVYFDTPNIIYTEIITESKNIASDTTEALRQLNASSAHTIASFVCFRDWRASNGSVRGRLRNLSGRIFQDGNENFWLDPGRDAARTYLYDIARDAAELGFDEILLIEACYPSVGRLDRILYGDRSKEENLASFFAEMRKTLEPYQTLLSVEVPKEILLNPSTPHASGMSIDVIAPYVDRVYAKVDASEIQACTDALAGVLMFVPELSALPTPAPARYVYRS